jgi:hypothetical protein
MTFEKQCGLLHDPVNPLAVDLGTTLFGQFPVHYRCDAAIAKGWRSSTKSQISGSMICIGLNLVGRF